MADLLGRATAFVYWHLVVGLLLCAASLPSVVLLLLLDRELVNVALVPVCLVPYGPALSAALYALRDRTRSDGLTPAVSFWRGYRSGAVDVLRVWTPAMLALAVVAGGVASLGPAGVDAGYAAVLGVIGTGVALWALDGLVIASFFSFRARDVARLAAHYLARSPRVTVGLLALLVVAAGVVWLTSEAVLWLFAVVWAAFLLVTVRPLVADVTARFTVPADVLPTDPPNDRPANPEEHP